MNATLLAAKRRRKSSRGTPRLRRPWRKLHGAPRRAAPSTVPDYWPWSLLATRTTSRYSPCCSHIRGLMSVTEAHRPRHPLAACGGVLVSLDWPALTPALIEIRLF